MSSPRYLNIECRSLFEAAGYVWAAKQVPDLRFGILGDFYMADLLRKFYPEIPGAETLKLLSAEDLERLDRGQMAYIASIFRVQGVDAEVTEEDVVRLSWSRVAAFRLSLKYKIPLTFGYSFPLVFSESISCDALITDEKYREIASKLAGEGSKVLMYDQVDYLPRNLFCIVSRFNHDLVAMIRGMYYESGMSMKGLPLCILEVPSYIPDTGEVREDCIWEGSYLLMEGSMKMDAQMEKFIENTRQVWIRRNQADQDPHKFIVNLVREGLLSANIPEIRWDGS